ncbi:MAG: chromate transporter [Treponema sp.]|nr:chromate transporter [Treponema sp.]
MIPSQLELFCIFFYVGLFTIGGGLVAITLMQQTIVDKGYITPDIFYNMVAISESTPGPIGMNMATYIGYNFYGIPGAIITTFAQALPSLITILLIAYFLTNKFSENPVVKSVFKTLRPATCGLILFAAVKVFVLALMNIPQEFTSVLTPAGFVSLFKWPCVAFYAVATTLLFKTKIHPVLIVLAGALFGVLFL